MQVAKQKSYDDESGSAPSSIRSQSFSLSSYYQSMYEVLNKIGKDEYGRVFECRPKLDGMMYALKKIPFNEDNEDQGGQDNGAIASSKHCSLPSVLD
ncbi:uncharacterized protein [Primulina eburnea]|uniref:uncharacterized protein isoform X6 n=1 Tax=Primulina eburnea TaxID=1245227 RepID=UPI003C6C3EC1